MQKRRENLPRFLTDKGFRKHEKEKCAEDIVYWLTYYGWIFNPQVVDRDKKIIPFIPFAYQEEFLEYLWKKIVECNSGAIDDFIRENIVIPKTRETAASWSTLAVFAHRWQFHQGKFLILSRTKEEVDEPGNMGTSFAKIRFLLQKQPACFLPEGFNWDKHSARYRLTNPEGGHIGADAMSESAGAGDRCEAILYDEFAKVQKGTARDYEAYTSCSMTANVHVFVSTLQGSRNKMAKLVSNKDNDNAKVFWFWWWKDPRKGHGLTFAGGRPTSKWQRECQRTLDKKTYASQIDCSMADTVEGGIYSDFYNENHQRRRGFLLPDQGNSEIIVSLDPGVHFVAQWSQIHRCGCYWVFRQKYWRRADIDTVCEDIVKVNNEHYRGYLPKYIGDPSGATIAKASERNRSEYDNMRAYGMVVLYSFMFRIPRPEWIIRGHQSCIGRMTKMCPTHKQPSFLIDIDECMGLHAALEGEYHYKTYPDGTPKDGDVDEFHPVEDYADAFKYPPLFKNLYQVALPEALQPKKKDVSHRKVQWVSPSEM